jgi:hypothetical protein
VSHRTIMGVAFKGRELVQEENKEMGQSSGRDKKRKDKCPSLSHVIITSHL